MLNQMKFISGFIFHSSNFLAFSAVESTVISVYMFLRQKIQQIMLSKRSKAVCSKQGLFSDANSFTSPLSAIYRFKVPTNCDFAMNPTSNFETKSLSATRTTSSIDHYVPNRDHTDHPPSLNVESNYVGLALVDTLMNVKSNEGISDAERKLVLFGSNLGVQIPQLSPIEFGVNTKPSTLASFPPDTGLDPNSDRCLSASEMELSEEYTRVTAHGPNPRTTHIFDNYIVNCCGDILITSAKQDRHSVQRPVCVADDFLSYCDGCKKSLREGKDIFMYRGEKAYCSQECRYTGMQADC